MAIKKLLLPNLPHRHQEQTLWCWAANVDMVTHSFNPELKQCQIAGEQFDTDDCDQPGELAADGTTSNRAVNPEDVEIIWKENGVEARIVEDRVSFGTLKSEIDEGRPVQVGWRWDADGGHVVIVRGYKQDDNEDENGQVLYINDPLEEPLDENETVAIRYSDLLTANNEGRWVFTWTGLTKDVVPRSEPGKTTQQQKNEALSVSPDIRNLTITVQIHISEE